MTNEWYFDIHTSPGVYTFITETNYLLSLGLNELHAWFRTSVSMLTRRVNGVHAVRPGHSKMSFIHTQKHTHTYTETHIYAYTVTHTHTLTYSHTQTHKHKIRIQFSYQLCPPHRQGAVMRFENHFEKQKYTHRGIGQKYTHRGIWGGIGICECETREETFWCIFYSNKGSGYHINNFTILLTLALIGVHFAFGGKRAGVKRPWESLCTLGRKTRRKISHKYLQIPAIPEVSNNL